MQSHYRATSPIPSPLLYHWLFLWRLRLRLGLQNVRHCFLEAERAEAQRLVALALSHPHLPQGREAEAAESVRRGAAGLQYFALSLPSDPQLRPHPHRRRRFQGSILADRNMPCWPALSQCLGRARDTAAVSEIEHSRAVRGENKPHGRRNRAHIRHGRVAPNTTLHR